MFLDLPEFIYTFSNMNEILFPSQYKRAILKKQKNTTIRIGKEIGKYKVGKSYLIKSYSGNSWHTIITINTIQRTTINHLSKFGISKKSIESLQRKEKIFPKTPIEIIRFKYK